MTWWAWTLLWVVLVAASLGVCFLIARSLWRSAVALMDELSTAADRLSAVRDEMETLQAASGADAAADLAVFADPTRLRQERILAARPGARAGGTPRKGARH